MVWTRVTGTGEYFGTWKNEQGVEIHWNGSLPFYAQKDPESSQFIIRKINKSKPDIQTDGKSTQYISGSERLLHSILNLMCDAYQKGKDDMFLTLRDDQK